jgi:hypothetical protein
MNHETHERHERKKTLDLLFKDECSRIVGDCFEVSKEKGCGFLEAVYQERLEIELELQQIPNQPHPELTLAYKGRNLLQSGYRLGLLVNFGHHPKVEWERIVR